MGIPCGVRHIDNPRVEAEKHYYKPDSKGLRKLGFRPKHTLKQELKIMLSDLVRFKKRIEAKRDKIMPKILWRK